MLEFIEAFLDALACTKDDRVAWWGFLLVAAVIVLWYAFGVVMNTPLPPLPPAP